MFWLKRAIQAVPSDPHEYVFRIGFRTLYEHVEVAVLVEDAGVEELVLHVVPRAPAVCLHQIGVRIRRLRVLVEKLHVRVGWRAVEVEVVLLDVLAVVALAVGEPEEALLEDGVLAVPQRERETEPLLVVGDPSQAVFTPAIRPRSGMIVGEEVPGVSVLAVILAHGSPLPLAQVRAPLLPGDSGLTRIVQALLLRHIHNCGTHALPLLLASEISSAQHGRSSSAR
jgi:hypothetical protein